MRKKVVRYGLISTSEIGMKAHLPASLESKNSKIVSISSRTVSKAKAAAGEHGINRVNAKCPGTIKTEQTAKALAHKVPEGISLERFGTPEDTGEVVAFMASAEPNFITGQAITVDGFQSIT